MNTLHQNRAGERVSGERANNGSRDPIDFKAHWDWHNPLNLLPIGIAVITVLGVALMVLQ